MGLGSVGRTREVAVVVDSLGAGGAEQVVVDSVRELRARGSAVTVIHLSQAEGSALADEIRSYGGATVPFPATSSHSLLEVRRVLRLKRFLQDGAYCVVHTHLSNGNIGGVLAARLAGIPSVATLHSPIEHTHRHPRVRRAVETVALRLATKVIAVGPSVARANRRRVPHIDVLVNPVRRAPSVDPDDCRAVREELGGIERPVVIGAGRLTPLKRWPDLLHAFKEVTARHPRALLVIAGTGELATPLAGMVRDLDLTDSVRLLGHRDDLWRLFSAADVFAMASECEGLPLSLLEAMGSGLPVVATAVGDIPTVVSPQVGILVPPGRIDRLSAALNQLLDDPSAARRLGDAARVQVQVGHGMAAWGDRLETLYDEACDAGSRKRGRQ